MDYNVGMDVELLRQDVREGRVKLEQLIELIVTQQHQLAAASARIRELEEALDELRKQSSPTAKFDEPFSLKAEEKRQAARGRKSKKKKTKPGRLVGSGRPINWRWPSSTRMYSRRAWIRTSASSLIAGLCGV